MRKIRHFRLPCSRSRRCLSSIWKKHWDSTIFCHMRVASAAAAAELAADNNRNRWIHFLHWRAVPAALAMDLIYLFYSFLISQSKWNRLYTAINIRDKGKGMIGKKEIRFFIFFFNGFALCFQRSFETG